MQKPVFAAGTVADRMDSLPVTALHALLVLVCGLGLAFDMFEIVLGSALSAVFSMPPHALPANQLSLLLAAVYLGAVVGAPALGWLADKRGRRSSLMGVLLGVGLVSIAASQSQSATQLIWLRALSGIGLGAYPPIMMAYLTDQLPPRQRGTLVFAASAVAMLGPPGVIFLVRALVSARPLGLDAWRWGFIAGGVGAAFAAAGFALLPESPRFLARQGRVVEAERACRRFEASRLVWGSPAAGTASSGEVSIGAASTPAARPKRWPAVAALFLLSPWLTTAFPLLSGAALAQRGFKLPDTLLYIGIVTLGNIVGSAIAAPLVDRFERRAAIATFGLLMTLSITAFMLNTTPVTLISASLVFGLAAALYTPMLALYGAELFPTGERAATSAAGWALNRLGSASAPLLLLPLLRSQGSRAVLGVFAATWLASAVALSLSPRGQQRRAVA